MGKSSLAERLEDAIAARGVTLTWLSARLSMLGSPVTVATLSYWRSGKRIPQGESSLETLARLEDILGLPAGELAQVVPSRPRPGPDPRRSSADLVGLSEGGIDLLRSIGCDDPFGAAISGWSTTVDLGADRQIARNRTTFVWEARVDGVRSVPLFWHFDSPTLHGLKIDNVVGATLGPTAFDQDSGLFVAELVLPHPLMRGQTAVTEHSHAGVPERDDVTMMQSLAERRVTEAALWIRFDPTAVPVKCRSYGSSLRENWDEDVGAVGGSVHRIVRDFGPGRFGFTWEWPPS